MCSNSLTTGIVGCAEWPLWGIQVKRTDKHHPFCNCADHGQWFNLRAVRAIGAAAMCTHCAPRRAVLHLNTAQYTQVEYFDEANYSETPGRATPSGVKGPEEMYGKGTELRAH